LQNVARKRLADALDAHESGIFQEHDLKCCWHTVKLLMQAGIWQRSYGCPIEDPVPKKSKRRSLKKRKWRERMWAGCREDTKFRPALALLHIAGVRPKEIENGVIVTAHEDETVMRIYIRGVKNSKDGRAGQPWRWLTYDCRDTEYGTPEQYLQKLALLNDGGFEIKAHAKRLNDFVRRLGDKVFGKKKHSISPYSYRHQFCANIKGGSGLPGAKVAMAMGHQSDRTQKQYGSVRQSSGGAGIVEVKAAKKVHEHEKARKFPHGKMPGKAPRN
jgi:integrase